MRQAPPLKSGAHVRVIAPSGPFDRTLVLRGIAWLREHYRVTFDSTLFARYGFLAGSDERRLTELTTALVDPTIDAIVTARGGHGLLRIVQSVPWGKLVEHPKWLIGFSDPTVLHAEAWKVGIASIHAANVAGLGRGDAVTRSAWQQCVEAPNVPRVLRGNGIIAGKIVGPLVGGNLTVLTMLAAANRLTLPEHCILALEDVTETSYRVDRMLTALRVGGYLDRVAGYAIGEFTDCSDGSFRVPVERVLEDCLGCSSPIVGSLPFGHGRNNVPLLLGPDAELDGSCGTLRLGS